MRTEQSAKPTLDDERPAERAWSLLRVMAITAGCWAVPYIASKAHHAMQGELGVHGGPTVTAEDAAQYGGAAEISAAQWGNAAAAVLIVALILFPLVPLARSWNRWLRTLPVIVATVFLAGMTALFGMRVIAGDGGLPFALYMIVWTGLACLAVATSLSVRDRR